MNQPPKRQKGEKKTKRNENIINYNQCEILPNRETNRAETPKSTLTYQFTYSTIHINRAYSILLSFSIHPFFSLCCLPFEFPYTRSVHPNSRNYSRYHSTRPNHCPTPSHILFHYTFIDSLVGSLLRWGWVMSPFRPQCVAALVVLLLFAHTPSLHGEMATSTNLVAITSLATSIFIDRTTMLYQILRPDVRIQRIEASQENTAPIVKESDYNNQTTSTEVNT